jgi:cobalt-zinc-cadmium efflux system outer membrane protein
MGKFYSSPAATGRHRALCHPSERFRKGRARIVGTMPNHRRLVPRAGILVALVIGWVAAQPVSATAAAPRRDLTLAEALDMAEADNADLRLARTGVEAAQADVTTAAERPNPQLSLNVTAVSMRDAGGSGAWWDRSIDHVLRVDQPVELGGKRARRLDVARAGHHAAAADLDDASRLVRAVVTQAYDELHRAAEAERLAAEQAQLQARSLEAARLRLRAGDVAPLDAMRWEIEVARSESDLASARAARRDAEVALARLIGLDPATAQLQAADPWPGANAASPDPPPVDERPDLRAAQARVRRAEAAVALARAQQTRDVTVGLQVEHYPQAGSDTNTFGVGFSVPLFVWNRYQGELARALADARAAREALERTRRDAESERARASADLAASRARVAQLQDAVLEKAGLAARAAEYAYQRGALGLTDLLDARRAWAAVRLDALGAQAQFADALAAWTAAAMGAPPVHPPAPPTAELPARQGSSS